MWLVAAGLGMQLGFVRRVGDERAHERIVFLEGFDFVCRADHGEGGPGRVKVVAKTAKPTVVGVGATLVAFDFNAAEPIRVDLHHGAFDEFTLFVRLKSGFKDDDVAVADAVQDELDFFGGTHAVESGVADEVELDTVNVRGVGRSVVRVAHGCCS